MAKKVSISNRDEEAELVTPFGTFYFGADAIQEDDEEFNWRFTFTLPDGKEVCNMTVAEIAKATGVRDLCYDECPEILLAGMAHCMVQGWLKVKV